MQERNCLYQELKALQLLQNPIFEYEELSLNAESGWWSVNRLLKAGRNGADVLKLQKALKNNWGLDVNLTSRYDEKTVEAVKKFQKDSKLEEDGIAGPFTQAMIFESNYSWGLPKPRIIQQQLSTCWAAAYQSALPFWRGRPRMNVAKLLDEFKRFIDSSKAITRLGLAETAKKFNAAIQEFDDPKLFKIEIVKKLLLKTKSPILLIHFMLGNVGHTEVVFGFEVKEGLPKFWVMDPLIGDYDKLTLEDLQSRGGLIILVSPN
ncbi:MAG TPA: peptidoglycan-binding domain-containing protein [Pyrinomonadaceae bacterium]|nr:peptidoglycan-binding domain-containing protein [Pyrinomonadaceae bacterium]